MSYKITEVEGIGPSYAEKLAAADVTTTDDLLKTCCNPTGRKAVAEKTGISESTLLRWANLADLMRIKGIGKQYAELLEAAGVDTVKELRNRNAENLAKTMNEINAQKKLTRGSANVTTVAEWIEQAKTVDPMISH